MRRWWDEMPDESRGTHRLPPRRRSDSRRIPRNLHPAALEMRLDARVDDLLALGAVEEGAFRRGAIEDFGDKVADEVLMVELPPRRGPRRPAREAGGGGHDLSNLARVRGGE